MADDTGNQQNPNFDFIMKEEPKPKRSFKLPGNLPKPVAVGIIAVIVLFLVIVVASLFSGKSSLDNIYVVLSDAGEITSVASDADTNTTTSDTLSLAATIDSSLNSQQQQIKTYLSGKGTKLNTKLIAATAPATVTTNLSNAKLNNTYDTALTAYFKTDLTNYQSDIQKAYKDASPALKVILLQAFNSNKTLLDSKQLQ